MARIIAWPWVGSCIDDNVHRGPWQDAYRAIRVPIERQVKDGVCRDVRVQMRKQLVRK